MANPSSSKDHGKVEAAAAALYPEPGPAASHLMLRNEVGNPRIPALTVDAMRHEPDYFRSSGAATPDVGSLDPAALLPAS